MKYALLLVALFAAACGGNGPTTPTKSTTTTTAVVIPPPPPPILPANLVVPSGATFDLPNCQAKATLAAGLGLPTVTCPAFSGTMQNIGLGCAAGVVGTTTTSTTSGAALGAASWSFQNVVRANATFVYTGGAITVPSADSYRYLTVATWTNVSC
jgi:hypothetical protein